QTAVIVVIRPGIVSSAAMLDSQDGVELCCRSEINKFHTVRGGECWQKTIPPVSLSNQNVTFIEQEAGNPMPRSATRPKVPDIPVQVLTHMVFVNPETNRVTVRQFHMVRRRCSDRHLQ